MVLKHSTIFLLGNLYKKKFFSVLVYIYSYLLIILGCPKSFIIFVIVHCFHLLIFLYTALYIFINQNTYQLCK